MHVIYLLLVLFLGIFGNSYAICPAIHEEEIQHLIDNDRLKYHIPGIEISIHCAEESFIHDFASGTTTIDGNAPIQTNHLFQIGSETKSFIATIILQLEGEGLLSIEDSLSNYLENLPPSWQNITIEQLLNHQSGIFNYTDVLEVMVRENKFDLSKTWTSNELVQLVVDKALYFPPGSGWHYSNTNYVLAGQIIEKITQRSIAEELQSRLFTPLQLNNTYYLPSIYTDNMLQRMAHGYSERGLFPDEPRDITSTNNSWANAAGAIVATSHDTAQWFRHLMNGSLLAPQQMTELMSVVDATLPNTTQKIDYGLGVIHDKKTFQEEAWWHSGGTLGYSALMIWLKDSDIVITANISHINATRDIYVIMSDLVDYIHHLRQM